MNKYNSLSSFDIYLPSIDVEVNKVRYTDTVEWDIFREDINSPEDFAHRTCIDLVRHLRVFESIICICLVILVNAKTASLNSHTKTHSCPLSAPYVNYYSGTNWRIRNEDSCIDKR